MNENAMANVLVDVDFLEEQFRGAGRADLISLFSELRAVRFLSPSLSVDFLKPLTPPCRQYRSSSPIPSPNSSYHRDARQRSLTSSPKNSRRCSTSWHVMVEAVETNYLVREVRRDGKRQMQWAGCSQARVVDRLVLSVAHLKYSNHSTCNNSLRNSHCHYLYHAKGICGLRYLLEL